MYTSQFDKQEVKIMRNILYLLLAAAMFFSSIWQASVTGASNEREAEQQQANQAIQQDLPDYDVRDEIRSVAPGRVNQLGAAVAATDSQVMQSAIESFRAGLSPDTRDNLRVVMNEVGLPKMVFNSEAPLSGPQLGDPDPIARGFLAEHSAMFGLSRNQIFEMRLNNVDNDKGTAFLNYEQMVDGIPVFQGQVQVTVKENGEGFSVNKGLVIPEAAGISTIPVVSDSAGIQRAFQFAGRQAPASFDMMVSRSAKGDRAVYKNPFGENLEDVLSEMTSMRVGPRAVLAWHSYVAVGPA